MEIWIRDNATWLLTMAGMVISNYLWLRYEVGGLKRNIEDIKHEIDESRKKEQERSNVIVRLETILETLQPRNRRRS